MTSDDIEIPEDLQIKIGTQDQVVWTNVLREAKSLLKQSKENILVQQGIIELAESKIEAEKKKV